MKCLREMNGMKESLKIKIKNQNVIAYFHVASTNYDTSLLGRKCIAEKIWIPIYLPWSANLGGVIDTNESGRNGLISSPMLCFLNMGVNCSYLQRNIFSQASIQFNKKICITL